MAESIGNNPDYFRRLPRALWRSQKAVIWNLLRYYSLTDEGRINSEFGTFGLERDLERGPNIILGFDENLTMFCMDIRGKESLNARLELNQDRRLRFIRKGIKRVILLYNERLRVVNNDYTGWFNVTDSGLVLLNIKDSQGNPMLSDEGYRDLIDTKGSDRFKSFVRQHEVSLYPKPVIYVAPDDLRGDKIQVITFDPLVSTPFSENSLIPAPLDAVVFDSQGNLLHKRVRRLGVVLNLFF